MRKLCLIILLIICFYYLSLSSLAKKDVYPLKEGNVWISENPDIQFSCAVGDGIDGKGQIVLENETINIGVLVVRGRYLRFIDLEEYNKNGETVESTVLEGIFDCEEDSLKVYLFENTVLDSDIKSLHFKKQISTED